MAAGNTSTLTFRVEPGLKEALRTAAELPGPGGDRSFVAGQLLGLLEGQLRVARRTEKDVVALVERRLCSMVPTPSEALGPNLLS